MNDILNPVYSFKILESFSSNLFIMYIDIQMAHCKFPEKQRCMQITLNHINRLSRSNIHAHQWQSTVCICWLNTGLAVLKLVEKNSKIKNLLSAGKWIFNMLQLLIRKTMKTKIAHFSKEMKIETEYNGDKILRFKRSRLYGSPTKTTQPLKNIKHQ